jgi:predicted DNA-binding protein YlxM (UPF0122 family)
MSKKKYEHLVDEWIRLYEEKDKSLREIAEEHPATRKTISRYLQEEGVNTTQRKYENKIDEWTRLYTKEGLSVTEIAEECSANSSTVSSYLQKEGVTKPGRYHHLVEKWASLYEDGNQLKEIAGQFNVAPSTVSKYLNNAGIDTGPDEEKPIDEWVYLYEKKQLSTREIAKRHDHSSDTIARHLKEAGVQINPYGRNEEITKDLLLSKVNRSGQCWTWETDLKGKDAYPAVTIDGKRKTAHRAAYKLWNGNIPEGHVVRHKCDNKLCIRPAHLETGTHQENLNDQQKLIEQFHALTQDDLRDILGREEEDWLQIAEDHDVRLATIRYILEEK